MRFAPSFLDEIRDRVPISSVIGARVSWDKRKTNTSRGDYWACCPFHGEKSPSFHCEDKKGRYHCFGCGASGDHFRFLTELDGLSFPEAVERVAELAGVSMPARDPEMERREQQRASLHDVMEMATRFFQDQLQAAGGAKARAYLRERGLSSTTQQAFRLGYAPDGRNALKEHLAAKGVTKDQIEACGLVRHGDDIPVSYDWFRDRVMFPIEDSRGRVIAFGGRALSPDVPAKYMNSPDTELFHKGEVLYNFARARKGQGKDGAVIVVEGYMDVIALAQAGFPNVVAPLGTALTEAQLDLLWRMAPEPVLCFDGDKAGLKAAWRAADLALPSIQAGRTVRFAMLPEGQDPDDLVRAGGPEAFRAVLAETRALAEMVWLREMTGSSVDTPEGRAGLEKRLHDTASRIKDEGVRFHYAQDFRERARALFRPSRTTSWRDTSFRDQTKRKTAAEIQSITTWRSIYGKQQAPLRRDKFLVVMAINHPDLIEMYFDAFYLAPIKGSHELMLRMMALEAFGGGSDVEKVAVRHRVKSSEMGDYFTKIERELVSLGDWQAAVDSDINDVRQAFENILDLYDEYAKERKPTQDLQELWLSLIEAGDEETAGKLMAAQHAEAQSKRAPTAGDENSGKATGRSPKR